MPDGGSYDRDEGNVGEASDMGDDGTSKVTSSRATWRAVYSMFGPYAIANVFMVVAIVLAIVFQPKYGDPESLWPAVTMAGVMFVAGIFVVKGSLRLRQVGKSAREDRRRIAAGLPLDPEDQGDRDR